MQLLKKMSVKTILGNVLALFPKSDETKQPVLGDKKDLFRVYGIATSTKTGTSNFGDWTSFKGQFEAVILETGEVLRSAELFLPDVGTDALLGPVAKNVEDGGQGVRFALDIGAVIVADRTNPNIMKYEYTVKPVFEASQDDPLESFKKELPALPAPAKKAEAIAQAPAAAPAPEKATEHKPEAKAPKK